MRFQGTVFKSGRHWLAEVAVFDALTQGRTRADALDMMSDWFETMMGSISGSVRTIAVGRTDFEVATADAKGMISLLLRRQRQKSGLSLADAAARLGARSRNAYARYEQGRTVPTVAKLDELLKAIAPDRDLLVGQSKAA
ncbi:MAG TPA: helix-turn-helix transcriptional regulator [Gammaproteobacteria bacterium]|nr:helix-turn-helix transcriptional regulator [Gammaproteobacteria bacterium]